MYAAPQKKCKLDETAGGFKRLAKDLAASSVQLRDFVTEHTKEIEALEEELIGKNKIIAKLEKKNVGIDNENDRLENEKIDLSTDNDQLRDKIVRMEEKHEEEVVKRKQAEKKLKEYREAQRYVAAQFDSE